MKIEIHPKASEFICSLKDPRAQEKTRRRLEDIETYGIGHLRKAGVAEPLKGYKGLEEIKVKGDKIEYRYFGGALTPRFYGIFHGYIKKRPKLDQKEIRTALS